MVGAAKKTSSTSCGFILVKRMFRSSNSGGFTDEDFGLGIPEYIADNTDVPYTSLDDLNDALLVRDRDGGVGSRCGRKSFLEPLRTKTGS